MSKVGDSEGVRPTVSIDCDTEELHSYSRIFGDIESPNSKLWTIAWVTILISNVYSIWRVRPIMSNVVMLAV